MLSFSMFELYGQVTLDVLLWSLWCEALIDNVTSYGHTWGWGKRVCGSDLMRSHCRWALRWFQCYTTTKSSSLSLIGHAHKCLFCVTVMLTTQRYYLRRRLASGEGTMTVGVTLSRYVCVSVAVLAQKIWGCCAPKPFSYHQVSPLASKISSSYTIK